MCTFVYYLVPVLVAAHTVNNLDLSEEPENDGHESEGPQNLLLAWAQAYE